MQFRNIKGQIQKSKYTGNINIDIFNNHIHLFSYFPFVRLEDIKLSLKERVFFPFSISGKGTLTAYLNGPLKINQMSYNLRTQLSKIVWEREEFNSGFFHIESKNGYVQTRTAELNRNRGKMVFSGTIDPKGYMLANLKGSDLRLQESANIVQFVKSDINGILDFDMKLEGFFLSPVTTAQVFLKDTRYKGSIWKNSKILLKIRKKSNRGRRFTFRSGSYP